MGHASLRAPGRFVFASTWTEVAVEAASAAADALSPALTMPLQPTTTITPSTATISAGRATRSQPCGSRGSFALPLKGSSTKR